MDGIETHGEALFAARAEQDFEGIVGKRLDAPYKAGRQPSGVKVSRYSCGGRSITAPGVEDSPR
jgi:ATP-dependent DNA ligase